MKIYTVLHFELECGVHSSDITSRHPLKSQKDAAGEAVFALRLEPRRVAHPLIGRGWGMEPYTIKKLIIL